MSGRAPHLPGRRRAAVWGAVAALGMGGAAFAGCDFPGTGDDEETVATAPTATDTEATGPTGPSGENGGGGGGGGGGDQTPADTGPTVPESGGVGAEDNYDPEQDTEENDIPPPPGSPQEQFEQFCDENPGACD